MTSQILLWVGLVVGAVVAFIGNWNLDAYDELCYFGYEKPSLPGVLIIHRRGELSSEERGILRRKICMLVVGVLLASFCAIELFK
jgi:hypothetical protein